ncbi:MAG: type II secretion system protein [Deltaproteobacteria bacterium]|jgi:hypothetical protein|nr:type II secretion system protein [Deltaproteobacteria bacterium]MBW2496717.1 type II secretion system protein [Deltaproteobacteria bacterium]
MEATRPETTGAIAARHARGLTLLEVLAAFLIFTMVFTVLMGSSQTAVHSQGLAHRRLEANLLADQVLADLEVQMQMRTTPILPDSLSSDPFEIEVTEAGFGPDPGDDPSAALGGPGELDLASADVISLLALEMPEAAKFLRRYDVEVRWQEAEGPERVRRTTFAFDWESASAELAALRPGGLEDGSGGSGSDGLDEEDGARSDDERSATGRGRDGTPSNRRPPTETPGGSDDLTIEQMKCMLGIGPC